MADGNYMYIYIIIYSSYIAYYFQAQSRKLAPRKAAIASTPAPILPNSHFSLFSTPPFQPLYEGPFQPPPAPHIPHFPTMPLEKVNELRYHKGKGEESLVIGLF